LETTSCRSGIEEAGPVADVDSLVARNAELEIEVGILRAQVRTLQGMLFGPKADKVAPPASDDVQPDMFAGEATDAEIVEEAAGPAEPRPARKPSPRKPIPADLPRVDVVLEPAEEEKLCSCCGKPRVVIGEDTTEKLEFVPARLYVRRYVRPRYACPGCKEGVAQAPLPPMILPGAVAGPTLLASLLTAKYADHLPFCRQQRILSRADVDIPRARMSAWALAAAEQLRPLVDLMTRRVLGDSEVLQIDETSIKVLDPGGKKTRNAWLHVCSGDHHAPSVIFEFSESRDARVSKAWLAKYNGVVVTDGYKVYDKTAGASPRITHAGCMAHARRKFVEASKAGDERAAGAIALISKLYDVERETRDKDPGERLAIRQQRSEPILAELREWLLDTTDVLPKSPLGKAVDYALGQWPRLVVFAGDGRVPIDNNAVERAIRPAALGRKNWLFAGNERGGRAAATWYTLLESAKRAGHNPHAYLADLLERLPGHPINRLEELLPERWTPPAA
jgi:transposase